MSTTVSNIKHALNECDFSAEGARVLSEAVSSKREFIIFPESEPPREEETAAIVETNSGACLLSDADFSILCPSNSLSNSLFAAMKVEGVAVLKRLMVHLDT